MSLTTSLSSQSAPVFGLLVDPEQFFARRGDSGQTLPTHCLERTQVRPSEGGLGRSRPAAKTPIRSSGVGALGHKRSAWLHIACLVLVLGTVAVVGAEIASASTTGDDVRVSAPTMTLTARSGDSVWSLARRAQPVGDVRPLVDAIVAARGSPVLWVGDVVIIPTPN
jgi:hypothetical protein